MNLIDVSYLDRVNSTNDFSIDLIKKNISIYGVVISDMQINGRGKHGNKWISKKGNIFCSIYKRVKRYRCILDAQYKSLKIVKEYLEKIGIQRNIIRIKHPNDILINNKKVCGILTESIEIKKKLYLVVGIGLNLTCSPRIEYYKTTFLKKYLTKNTDKFSFVNYVKQNINYF
ncbi:MAG: biotin--[acetyl-CoA-carboxylase] ligase [Candidatus Pelagibacter sp.]|nr:biotin--[acetyl-CoA-carboxylase] ligase [Candidatus Pelagibacter sp.]OUV87311.1 MAG: biotin--[acetyl-CoA-carboxylase] ligase [Pelagibacteraceae bacterium TMED136]